MSRALRTILEANAARDSDRPGGSDGLDSTARTSFALSVLGLDRLALLREPGLCLSDEQAQSLEAAFAKLAQGMSPARILGRREFWSLDFEITADTLEPRPETEILVEQAVALLSGRPGAKLADLGTGTGCILLSILSECQQASGLGLDLSPGAVQTAQGNAERLGLADRASFLVSDWFATLGQQEPRPQFDLLVSNPPYIAAAVVDGLPKIVRDQDPRLALEGGADGLAAYRVLAAEGQGYLAPGGAMLLEIGFDQEASVAALFEQAGWRLGICKRDLAGLPRTWIMHAGGV